MIADIATSSNHVILSKGAELAALASILGSNFHLLPDFAAAYALVYYTITLIDRHRDRKRRGGKHHRRRG